MNDAKFKIIAAAALGNAIEWYDYAVYGSLSILLAGLFFPEDNPKIAFIKTLAVFALGFIMRPLGAIFFGFLGYRFGLAKTWVSSMIMMMLPTLFIGLLPTYNSIGFLAPLLLLVARLFQGIAISGEFPSALLLLKELSPKSKEGFSTSLIVSSIFLGFMLGTLVALFCVSLLSSSQMHAWGWRLPFLLSSVVAFILIYIRRRISLPETIKKTAPKSFKLLKILTHYRYQILLTICIYALPAVAFYVGIVFLPSFIEHSSKLSMHQSLHLNMIMMVVLLLSAPVGGYLADRYSRKLLLIISGTIMFLANLAGFYCISIETALWALPWLVIFAAALGIYYGVAAITMVSQFVGDAKLTGVAFAHGITFAMIGGTAPLIVSLMSHWMPAIIAAPVFITAVGVLCMLLLGRLRLG